MASNFSLERLQELERLTQESAAKQEDKTDQTSLVGEIGFGLLGGAERAVRDVAALGVDAADLVANAFGGDVDNSIARSIRTDTFIDDRTTLTGSIVQNLTEFSSLFVPVFGQIGRSAKLGRFLGLGRGTLEATELALGGAKGFLARTGRAAVAGAITDLAVLDGSEKNISALLQDTNLRSPILDFLATDPNDPDAVNRLRGALEGVFLGIGLDFAFAGTRQIFRRTVSSVKAHKAAQDVLAGGGTPQQAVQAARKSLDGDVAAKELGPTAERAPKEKSLEDALSDLGIEGADPEKSEFILQDFARRSARGEDPFVNPRELTQEELVARGLERTDANLKHFVNLEDGAGQLIQTTQAVYRGLRERGVLRSMTLDEARERAFNRSVDELRNLTGEPDGESLIRSIEAQVGGLRKSREGLEELQDRVLAGRTSLALISRRAAQIAQEAINIQATKGVIPVRQQAEWTALTMFYQEAVDELRGVLSTAGRVFRTFGADIDVKEVGELLGDINKLGGTDRVMKNMRRFLDLYEDPASQAGALAPFAKVSRGRTFMAMTQEFFVGNLLSALTTHAVSTTSGGVFAIFKPFEAMVGSAAKSVLARATGKEEAAAALLRSARLNARQFLLTGQGMIPFTTMGRRALRAAAIAFREGDAVLDPRTGLRSTESAALRERAITRGNVAKALSGAVPPDLITGSPWIGPMIDFVGTVIARGPSRLLATGDEWARNIVFDAFAGARLHVQAVENGIIKPSEIGEFVVKRLDEYRVGEMSLNQDNVFRYAKAEARSQGLTGKAANVRANGVAKAIFDDPTFEARSTLAERAVEASREVVLQDDPGALGRSFGRFVQNHPLFRFVFPFTRTPARAFGQAIERLPLAKPAAVLEIPGIKRYVRSRFPDLLPADSKEARRMYGRLVADLTSGDAEAAGAAAGKLLTGVSIIGILMHKVADGTVTGQGPADPETRNLLKQTGWQEYSIRVGDKFISYTRIDPFASLVGMVADFWSFAAMAHPDDQTEVETIGFAMLTALFGNMTNRTYLKGLADLVDAMDAPQDLVPRFLRNTASGFIPASSFLRRAAIFVEDDPAMRETRSSLDVLRSRIPGLSDQRPPMRNVLGEPVRFSPALFSEETGGLTNMFLPIVYREVSHDRIKEEFFSLGHGFSPPRAVRGGLDLRNFENARGQDAYDRWLQLHGQVKLNGRTLTTALTRLMNSAPYKRLSPTSTPLLDSPRIDEINKVIRRYRQRALEVVMQEYPELRTADRQIRTLRTDLRRGIDRRILAQ